MSAAPTDKQFSGSRNLEIMGEARNYNAFLLSLVTAGAPDGARLLDFGAGSGTISKGVAQQAGRRGQSLVCVEPDPMLRRQLCEAGLVALPSTAELGPRSVDVAYSLNVLEHIDDDLAATRSLFEVLRPGGRLLLYVPAFMVLFSAMDSQVGHIRRYRRRQLADVCTHAGFRVESSAYVDSLGFLAGLLLRFAGPRSGILDPRMVRFYDRFVFPVSHIADFLLGRLFGKNIFLRAIKPVPTEASR